MLAGATAFYLVDVLLIAAVLARWSRQPFLPLLRSAAFTTAATFAIMFSVSLALVVLWTQSPALALVLVGPLVAVALHQRATFNALRAMRLALTDPLTGLGNHRHFQEQLQIQLEDASAAREPLTVCLFDLDDFKQINDRYGHPAGDRVLAHVASKLREAARPTGSAVTNSPSCSRALRATRRPERAERARARPRRGGVGAGRPLRVTAGIATYPDHSNDRNALVRVADIALYWAKGEGKNRGLRLPARHARGHAAAAARAAPDRAPGSRPPRRSRVPSTHATRSRAVTRPGSAISPPGSRAVCSCPRRRSS